MLNSKKKKYYRKKRFLAILDNGKNEKKKIWTKKFHFTDQKKNFCKIFFCNLTRI